MGTVFRLGDWLVEDIGQCNCSPWMGNHEPYCGLEPVCPFDSSVYQTVPLEGTS